MVTWQSCMLIGSYARLMLSRYGGDGLNDHEIYK
jgi:hypothetical protein